MMKKFVGLFAAAVILSFGSPALAKDARHVSHVAIAHTLTAGWVCAVERDPGSFQNTTPQPFADRCVSVASLGR